ncbi:large subunit ribosomal protein L29 [Catalinimonas alkaloidigena]|uniref:Large ribosomal subunit protein uL29 n=1 Tax=Catalinimonas alkaloidigena TaxID=1075417 RepID=A0A1G9Q759_9BACT|nr:50S ribosomal protein L29 [Catalinimonas alkaloidigena]SDM06783.1 large subunit ribosomal protein L29 [Catalinimonas alkaloidigena]
MKNDEIRALSTEEVQQKLQEEQQALQKLKFAHAISPLENPMKIRFARKNIARLHTEITARNKASENK